MLSRDQAKHTADICETILWSNARPGWGAVDGEFYVKILEVGRHPCAQRIYFENGTSWTLSSDHLEQRATDLQIYRRGRPLYYFEHYRPLADHYIALDPTVNYWGYYDWGKDTAHLGRRRA